MSTNPLPKIDQASCTGCHLCVDACPTQALDQINGKAFLRYPDRCTYCADCEELCPEGAISLPYLIVLAQQPNIADDDVRATLQGGTKPCESSGT
ncbi:MAG: 4Fe-4S binding protein [Caldilineaceae bacterium]|nr:4Fe-4S binding protein [Caldilineaceae bacterium]